MKKTRPLCALLTLALLVCGCGNAPTTPTETPPDTSGNSAFVMPDIPEVTLDAVALVTEGLYCAGGDYDITLYPFSYVPFFFVDLYSIEPIPEDAAVSLKTSVPHSTSIMEIAPTGSAAAQYPYALYLCTQATDWPQLAWVSARAMYAAYEEEICLQQGITPTQEQKDRWKQNTTAYTQVYKVHEEAYEKQLTKWEDIGYPVVYQYRVGFNFGGWSESVNEVITEATLSYGGKTLTVPVGRIYLDGTGSLPHRGGGGLSAQTMAISEHSGGTPWGTGYLDISADIILTAEKNIQIKDLYFYNSDTKISKCAVELTSGGMAMDQLWTPGEDTIDLWEGDSVSFHITIWDDDLENREYAENLVLICEYEQDGKTYCENMDLQVIRRRTPYEVYLWAFEQADTQSYYQQFYNIVTSLAFMEE